MQGNKVLMCSRSLTYVPPLYKTISTTLYLSRCGPEAFRQCRFFFAMDGTFAKDTFNLTIPMAASVNDTTHAVSIARAIIESENEDAWRFVPSY